MPDPLIQPDSPPLDPVSELLRGGDPVLVASRAGISVEELLRRRDAFLEQEVRKIQEEDLVLGKVGRNDPCPCGSGRKYKKCCMGKQQETLARLDPEAVRMRTQRERERKQRDKAVSDGYAHLTARAYEKTMSHAGRWLERFPEDDRFHDMVVTAALYLRDLDQAARVAQSRWEAALKEKAFFLAHGRHSYDDPTVPLGHAYGPEAWLERRWVTSRAAEYWAGRPQPGDLPVWRWVKALQKADDPSRFPQQREEGLRVRREALASTIQALKEAGPSALPYLLPLCVGYGWTALLVPEILRHWGDAASVRALAEIALFNYPFLTERCLQSMEDLGERVLPFLKEAFERDREFDVLKIGLISVAGNIGTPEAMDWVTSLLDHPQAHVVNWAGGVLGQRGYLPALEKIQEAAARVGSQPKLDWALEELNRIQDSGGNREG